MFEIEMMHLICDVNYYWQFLQKSFVRLCVWRTCCQCDYLRKHGISFYNPQMEDWNMHYIALEAAVKDSCRLLLYVITDDTRAMTSMLEVTVCRNWLVLFDIEMKFGIAFCVLLSETFWSYKCAWNLYWFNILCTTYVKRWWWCSWWWQWWWYMDGDWAQFFIIFHIDGVVCFYVWACR